MEIIKIDLDLILNSLIDGLGSSVYFILITSENGVVIKSYINEDEFNKASISVNIAQLYELAEEITSDIGLQVPDFNLIHTNNFYILSAKILEKVIILLIEDQVKVKQIFQIINKCITPSYE